MPKDMPAVSLVAVPGRRHATLELAREIERRGFSGIYCPSPFGCLQLCEALALVTERIPFATSIQPIYARHVEDFAQSAAFLNEISKGRFRFGIGVSHGPTHARLGIQVGKPLGDIRAFVERLKAVPRLGELPPIILATLRDKMIGLAGEVADGMVFANAARSHMATSLRALPEAKRQDPSFIIANMIPTCISDDVAAAKAVNRRTLTSYALLPNYRNYWKGAGYQEEMEGVEKAVARGDQDSVPKYLTDRWLADTTLFGSASHIRDQVAEWVDAGVRTPVLVASSAAGNQMKAFEELFAAFAK
jgi:alkanesulfonate monooxygenase SsuD/methylene tetrahydromethanopterin reductase-like flavin-dependent oxidoreductase (luciferase family)